MAGPGFDMFDSILAFFKDPNADPKTKEALAGHLDSQGIAPPLGVMGMIDSMKNGDVGGMLSAGLGGAGSGLGGLISMLGGPKEAEAAPTGGSAEPSIGSLIPGVTSPGTTQAPSEDNGVGPFTTTVNPEPAGSKPQSAVSKVLGGAGQVLAKPPPMQEIPKGVSGGVKAPEHPAANPAFLNMIAALLNHPAAPHVNPGRDLGSMIR